MVWTCAVDRLFAALEFAARGQPGLGRIAGTRRAAVRLAGFGVGLELFVGVHGLGRTARHGANQSAMQQDLFRHALGEYLEGAWFEAESLWASRGRSPRDVDARLLLATLMRSDETLRRGPLATGRTGTNRTSSQMAIRNPKSRNNFWTNIGAGQHGGVLAALKNAGWTGLGARKAPGGRPQSGTKICVLRKLLSDESA